MTTAIDLINREDRIREFKSDTFIRGCQKQIEIVLNFAVPHIVICLEDREKSVFDIDEKSKKVIKYWQDKIDEHIATNYPDLIKTPA